MMTENTQIQQNPASETLVRANDAWCRTVAKTGSDTGFPKTALTPELVQTVHVQAVRVRADQRAFRSRYHDPACHEVLRPKDRAAGLMLAALEQGRVGALGSGTFPGASRNMAEHISWAFHSLPLFEQLEAFAFTRLTPGGTISVCHPGNRSTAKTLSCTGCTLGTAGRACRGPGSLRPRGAGLSGNVHGSRHSGAAPDC